MKSPLSLIALAALLITAAPAQQPGITAETWTGLTPGKSILILRKEGISTRAPNITQTRAEAKITGLPANSGTRLRGTITPPADDTYTFWVNGTDNVALWISEDGTRFTKRLIANHLGSTTQTEWAKHPHQKSIPIALTAGVTYHIEAHVMTSVANGHLSIAWQGSKGNWALAANGATATQSTTQWALDAAKAIDGNTNGVWNQGTMTTNVQNSWLKVDFAATRPLNRIVLHNNSNDQLRLSNFRLSALDGTGTVLAQQDFFTTSGNVGSSFTWEMPATVQAASIRIQLLGNNRANNGHLALAEIQAYGPGPYEATRNFQVIPSAFLTTATPPPADTNDNHLPDTWEQQTGLTTSMLPGALLEYGDPDNDGITNYEENLYGSNPLAAETMADGLIRSLWMDETSGTTVASFVRNRARFLSYPNDTAFLPNIDNTTTYLNHGSRYRGSFTAPSTGTYRFWISGSSDAELWLSDGSVKHPDTAQTLTNRFGKELIATSGHVTPVRDYDYNTKQRSHPIQLTAGQTYYIEVLQKINQGSNHHVSVAWQTPGQPRAIIPPTAFLSNAPAPLDVDDDNLPDAWETSKGLNPANNGRTSAADGEYGDPDNDKLTNLEEFQNGTIPFSTDSDGDTIPDYDEVKLYGSNPAVSNNLAPVTLSLPALNQYTAATGAWLNNANGSLTASDSRGTIRYSFTVTQPGVHEVVLAAAVVSPTPWMTSTFPVELSINGASIAQRTMSSRNGAADTLRALTPWLGVGPHTVTVHHHNFSASLRLRIDSLALKRLGGIDLDSDGVPDWIEEKEAPANTLTRIPETSLTSPLSIEGITTNLPTATLSASSQPVELTPSINNGFFANIPLSESATTTVNTSFLGGILTETHDITWLPTNLLEYDSQTLHIRQGDSLRLTAHNPAESATGTFTATAGSAGLQPASSSSDQPLAFQFNTPGTHTLTATWTPVSGPTQTASITLTVHTASFGSSHLVRVGTPRPWALPGIPATALIEADERLVFTQTSTSGTRTYHVASSDPVNRHVIARLPADLPGAPSAILALGTVHNFDVARVDRTRDAQIVTRYEDGTWLMRSTVVAVNLPPEIIIRMTAINQGTLFTNGTTILDLTSADFDANGIAQVYYEWDGSGSPKLCHKTQLFIQN